ncbi:kinase-like domain-containing protein [Spinellus fusiger]|nr:kinase-like domain-containing protein [Spinellus fusiger]
MPKIDLTSPAVLSTRVKDPKDTPVEREQRTVREMAIMHLLNHPNICQLKEWISEGEHYYMFLEYVDGGQLLDYIINHGKLREKQARKFARQIVSALDYCHRNSIVHRDLKIENILITKDEDIKIIDFGLSNLYSPSSQLSTFCGSLYFAAPELLQARQYTGPEVDVWSFGVVLYVLVCGRVPFDDTSLPALHAKIKAGVVDHYPDHLSKDCVDLLSNLLVVDPKKRATLSAIRSHPWINKGYDEPIYNHLPHRLPLNTIDMKTVEGMHGFGLGEPEDIRDKLEHYISLSEYQQAASKIDQNYQRHAASQNEASRPRWRRSLIHKKKRPTHDDPQSLPAMYDPLVSVYYLVKERKEFDEQQAMEDNLSVYSSPDLRRSNSSLSRTKYEQHTLTRRKSERIPATPRLNIEEIQGNGHGEGYRALTRSRSERTSSTIKENAAKLMGVVRSHSRGEDPERPDPPSFLSPPSITSADPESISSSHSTPVKKPHHYWWKFDNSATQPRSSWRRLSVNKHSSKRSLADPLERSTSDSLAIPPVPRVASANIDIRKGNETI